MKTNLKLSIASILATLLSGTALAEETATKSQPSGDAHSMGSMGGGGGMMGGEMMSEERLKQKQAYTLKMHELSGKILATTDAKARDKLKAEQLGLMKEHQMQHHMMMMKMMQQKGGMMMPGMKGDMKGMQGGDKGDMKGMKHGSQGAAQPSK